jgi:hypothetical protein
MVRSLVLVLGLAACSRDPAASSAAPLAGKPFYRIDAGAQKPCASGTACEVQLVLTALAGYHVNQDYPFKFLGAPGAPPVDGTGTFGFDGAKRGTMTVVFRPAKPGTAKLVGTFKLSVCSDETCEIESPTLELAVPVT